MEQELFRDAMDHLEQPGPASAAELVAASGRHFLGRPYASRTLEKPDSLGREQLVINLEAFDCTTLAENCLALARTMISPERSYERYCRELEYIRYRDGSMDGYPSRLHYFCEWVRNNGERGVVFDPGLEGGDRLNKEIHFMSSHPDAYEALSRDTSLVKEIRQQEKVLSRVTHPWYPLETADLWIPGLEEGDIVGITTAIDGLLVSHVGIIIREKEQVRLLHASMAAGKVVISEESLERYLEGSKGATGILLARPL